MHNHLVFKIFLQVALRSVQEVEKGVNFFGYSHFMVHKVSKITKLYSSSFNLYDIVYLVAPFYSQTERQFQD